MARRRFQDPKPRKEGKWWYLRLWEDVFENGMRVRKLKRIKLALATMGERQVRKIALDIVAPKNKSIITTGAAVNFSEYVDTAYMNTAFKKLSSTTRACYQGMIDKHLKPAFGKSTLSEITPYAVDAYFSAMPSRGVSHPLASKIMDTLSSFLRSAVVQAHCRQSTRRARGRSRQAREESKALHLPISIRRAGTDHTRAVRNNGLRRGVDWPSGFGTVCPEMAKHLVTIAFVPEGQRHAVKQMSEYVKNTDRRSRYKVWYVIGAKNSHRNRARHRDGAF